MRRKRFGKIEAPRHSRNRHEEERGVFFLSTKSRACRSNLIILSYTIGTRYGWLQQKNKAYISRYALGRDPDFRNGRDANGPIFPVGDVDPRLPVHEDIIGVLSPSSGKPVAFQRSKAFLALKKGQEIVAEGVKLELDAGGVRAVGVDGTDLGSHQAFWFAWSQFYPDTLLWRGG